MDVLRPAATTGERVGPYEILDRIFDAPFGAVELAYVASGVEEGRIVMLERVPVAATEAVHARVLKTSLAARSMRHPRIVAVLEAISRPADVVIVSEHVEAVSLRSLMRRAFIERAPLPPPVAVSIATDTVRALKAGDEAWRKLGGQPVSVQGGLVPDAVLLASYGDTLLMNVGVSSLIVLQSPLGAHVDVLPYRAPESLAGKADERADVYAVGVLLWEMLANRPLFGGRDRFVRSSLDAVALRKEVSEAKAPRLDGIARGGPPIPRMLIELVQQLLAPDPAARFPTLGALLSALEKLAGDLWATPEQIGAAVTRLAEKQLDAQRMAIERVAVPDRKSLSPESTRSTGRPAPLAEAEAPRLLVPRFSAEEAPTARRRQRTPPLTPSPVVAVPPPPRLVRPTPLPLPDSVLARDALAAPLFPDEAVQETHSFGGDAPSGIIERAREVEAVVEVPEPALGSVVAAEPIASEVARVVPHQPALNLRRRRLVVLVAAVVLGAGVLALIAVIGSRSAKVVGTAPSAAPPIIASAPTAAIVPTKPEPSEGDVAPDPPASSQAHDAVRSPVFPAPVTSRPSPKKPYRPHGI